MKKMIFPEQDFPNLDGMVYLNSAAEGIPPTCVRQALEQYWQDKLLGMQGRQHHFARRDACREVAARLIGLEPRNVSFCSCSAEAYNLLATALKLVPGDEVVVNDLDFPSGATPWLSAVAPTVRVWRSRNGALELDDLKALLTPRTRLVQVSLVSFYNGYRLDWNPFRDLVRSSAGRALISVDITQALGRVELDCRDADCLISSTHKWVLGLHGGCIVGIPQHRAEALTTRAGGWFHIGNAFEVDRFERVVVKPGADSYAVGMPNFAAIYALEAALRYVEGVGVGRIAAHADPLVEQILSALPKLGLKPMARVGQNRLSGIIAFQHSNCAALQARLEANKVHVMHHAGRLRVSVHGYNTEGDIEHLLDSLMKGLRSL
ncbi:MAG: aminotransferase class V-fold PLP-dependent enzyme [Verrucomicrobiota bacterium]